MASQQHQASFWCFSVSIVNLEQLYVFRVRPSFIMLNGLLEKPEEPALFTLRKIYSKKLVKGDIIG